MIPWFKPHFWGNERVYLLDALNSTWISDGEYIHRFEKEFSKLLTVKNTVTVSNGTTALQLALLSLKIKAEDEIIIPGYTFAAPANMTLAIGAKPVFADVDLDTWCVSPAEFEKKITPKTKAIIPVHVYGNVCEMNTIREIAKLHKITVIEDAAEAAFSKYFGEYVGTLGDISCFSFQATKTIAMGEGGALVTNNDILEQNARLIRNHGMRSERRYWHEEVGHNFRLTNLQAALGCAQLEKISEIINNKKRVYQSYKERLKNVDGIKMQYIHKEIEPVIWAIGVQLDPSFFRGDRNFVMAELSKQGIETRPGFYSFNSMPLYNAGYLPISHNISQNMISLPSYPTLTVSNIDFICEKLLALRK